MHERDELQSAGRARPRSYHGWAPEVPEEGLDLFEVFPPHAEIEMEIGFGRGMFLRQRLGATGEGTYLLGIEIRRKWAYLVARRFERAGESRARVFGGDVREILSRIRPAASIARAFLHFPDPWWKKRHKKRLVMGDHVLAELARLLRPRGEFFVQTDVEARAQAYLEQLRHHPDYEVEGDALYPDNPYQARSNREQRALDNGLPIYRILARRSVVSGGERI